MSSRPNSARPRTSGARRATARRVAAVVGVAATTLPLLGVGTASAASAADWQRLSMCESGGNWHINTGNGYYGGLQFSSGTWLAYGGGAYASRADLATPEQQMAIANKVLAAQGWNAWPACSRSTGLYGTPTAATPPPPPPPMVYGEIGSKYAALGGARGMLGAVMTPESAAAHGGRYNLFQRGAIYWTSGTGAHEVHGDIGGAWRGMGAERSALGFPVSDELGSHRGGAYNVFEFGSVYWSPTTGAHAVRGAIGAAWAAQGYEAGALGFPVSNETGTPNGRGAYSTFEGGSVYWAPPTGAHVVKGAIRDAWGRSGFEGGPLGFPKSDETPVAGGAQSLFEGGVTAWSPATGAHVVQGAINATWWARGGATSRLGFPTSDEYTVPGGRRSDFQHGTVTWTPDGRVSVALR